MLSQGVQSPSLSRIMPEEISLMIHLQGHNLSSVMDIVGMMDVMVSRAHVLQAPEGVGVPAVTVESGVQVRVCVWG